MEIFNKKPARDLFFNHLTPVSLLILLFPALQRWKKLVHSKCVVTLCFLKRNTWKMSPYVMFYVLLFSIDQDKLRAYPAQCNPYMKRIRNRNLSGLNIRQGAPAVEKRLSFVYSPMYALYFAV